MASDRPLLDDPSIPETVATIAIDNQVGALSACGRRCSRARSPGRRHRRLDGQGVRQRAVVRAANRLRGCAGRRHSPVRSTTTSRNGVP